MRKNADLKFVFQVAAAVMLFVFGLAVGSWMKGERVIRVGNNGIENVDDAYLQEIISLIDDNYIENLDSDFDFTSGAAKGIVATLNDQYSAYLTAEEFTEYYQSNGSEYEGIGVQLAFQDGYTVAQTVFEGSPAEAATIQEGDVFIKVNGEDVSGEQPAVVASKIRGDSGTSVDLQILRIGSGDEITVTVKRGSIDLDNVTFKDLGGGVIKINISKFTEGATDEVSGSVAFQQLWDEVVDEVVELSPEALVIDLRSNPGGFLSAVQHVAEDFLSTGQVIYREKEKNKPEIITKDSREGRLEGLPLVVLVNEGSASAAEIFAGTIQDNNRGEIIGENTFGKGVEQRLIELSDGGAMLLVFRAWLTPNGHQVDADNPILPDIEVSQDYSTEADEVLIKALSILQ